MNEPIARQWKDKVRFKAPNISIILMIAISIPQVVLCVLGYIASSPDVLFFAVVYAWLALVYVSIKVVPLSTMPILFCISFFTFLIGKNVLAILSGKVWWEGFSRTIAIHTCSLLLIAITFLLFGLLISASFVPKNRQVKAIGNENTKNVRSIASLLFYFTIIFKLIVELETGVFVVQNSYLALYTTFQSKLPYVFHKIAETNAFFFFIFLVTYPTKKQSRHPVIIFVFTSFLTILSGSRGEFVLHLLIVLGYILLRHYTDAKDNTEKWITKKAAIACLILIPFGIIFLAAYNNIRNNQPIALSGSMDYIAKFFDDQGGSWRVIAYAKQFENEINETRKSYVFGQLIYFFRYGFLSGLISGNRIPVPSPNTLLMAMDGTNLGSTVSHLVLGNSFLEGHGIGTQYIAELFADFGYIGVALFNAILGFLLFRLRYWAFSSKWYINALALVAYSSIIGIPRDFALSWITIPLSVKYWAIIIGIAVLAKYWSNLIKPFRQLTHRKGITESDE